MLGNIGCIQESIVYRCNRKNDKDTQHFCLGNSCNTTEGCKDGVFKRSKKPISSNHKKESHGKKYDKYNDMEENSSESDDSTMEVEKLEQSSNLHSKPERLQQKRNKKKKNENYNVARQVVLYIQSR